MDINIHEQWMQLARSEAMKGLGNTHPNPSVGAVVVRDGEVLGQGFTQPCGGNHAEVQALNNVQGSAAGATLYVTLEPCASVGKTPACTSEIIKAGIKVVVFASSDPNPKMAGGADILKQAGITVISSVGKADADILNRPFFHYVDKGMPWVIAKAAVSLDGKMATYSQHSQWISGQASRQHAHHVRALCDAIVVGIGTLLHDNPSLTVRDAEVIGEPPLRVVMGEQSPEPFKNCKLLSGAAKSRFYVLKSSKNDRKWRDLGMEVVLCDNLQACFKHLADSGCLQVLLEGGGKLHAACFEAQISNEMLLYQAPILIGGVHAMSYWHGLGANTIADALSVENIERLLLDNDMLIRGDIVYPA